ncbi:MAG TPA: hypothetical protein VGX25_25645 [Actinophytocola sp.]|uniref:hypothetical protein n=1 Tax=Actinophytocola sp. TaxID=1872138 RepID=UPI002DDDA995|nr:hypothetical protein [Actinophytocola sp.]HEV2782789.1 hypothetical protein [Actinophytocola sp.]
MSKRARNARQLASLLTGKSGTLVRVYYDHAIHRHRVIWTRGPDVAQMYNLAMRHAHAVPGLDLTRMLWDRGTSD